MQIASTELSNVQPIRAVAEGFFRHWRLFTLVVGTVVLLVTAVTLSSKKQYRSEMKFLLENKRSNAVITPDRSAAPALTEITEQQINSELEVLGSEDVIGSYADPTWSSLPAAQRTPAALKLHEDRLLNFRKRLRIDPARKSNVINVSYTAPSSVEATEALERFSSAYLSHRKSLSRPSGTSNFFAEEAGRYQQAWQQANRELVQFQQKNHLVSVRQTEDTLSKEISGYEDDLRGSQASLQEMEGRLNASGKAAGNVPERQQTQQRTIFSQTSADQMRSLLVQLQNRRTELLTRYTPSNRLVVELDRQIADTTASLNAALAEKGSENTTDINPAWQQVRSSLVEGKIEQQALKSKSAALGHSITDLRGQLSRLQALDVSFNALEQKADEARNNFEMFSEKRDQAQIEDAMDERKLLNIAVAERPTSTFHPASPKPLLNAALGGLTALFLAAGAVYLAESSRSTVASARELESLSRFPVLATVPFAVPSGAEDGAHLGAKSLSEETSDPLSVRQRMVLTMQKLRKPNEA